MNREMAVAIAKDVIELLNNPEYNIRPCSRFCYISARGKSRYRDKDLRDILPELARDYCTVCALGALLLSKANLFNAVSLNSITGKRIFNAKFYGMLEDSNDQLQFDIHPNKNIVISFLNEIFSLETLELIEAAFEGVENSIEITNEQAREAAAFGYKYKDDKQRVIAIMQNIIDNDGEFIVSPATQAEVYKEYCNGHEY